MAVVIQNISETVGLKYGEGEQLYILAINRTVLCEFTHNFSDGLPTCLRKAAEAFEEEEKGGER